MSPSELAISVSLICVVTIMALMALSSLSSIGLIIGGFFLLCAAIIIIKCNKVKPLEEDGD